MKEELVFVYGTLMLPDIQLKVVGRSSSKQRDTLAGYTKSNIIVNGNQYLVADPDPTSFIDGLVLSVNQAELIKLDEYETRAYRRVMTKLQSGVEAWVYTRA